MSQPSPEMNSTHETSTEDQRQDALAALEDVEGLLRRPIVGASVAGGVVLAAGALFGFTEAVVAAVAAYAVFRSLKEQAATRIEEEQGPEFRERRSDLTNGGTEEPASARAA